MYAEVLVNLPVEGTFHYHIPPDFAGRLQIGHLVEVSFGNRRAQGVVLALTQDAPVSKTKPVDGLLDHIPVVDGRQLALARWLSETYLTPLADCVRLMLPPGLSKRGDVLVSLAEPESEIDPEIEAALPDTQRRVLSLLRKRGSLRGRQLAHSLPHRKWRVAVQKLADGDLVERVPVLSPPSTKPKLVRTVTLTIPPENVGAAILHLGSPSPHADALEVLAEIDDPLPTVDQICARAGCSLSHLEGLARRDLVHLTSARTWASRTEVPIADRITPVMRSVLDALEEIEGKSLPDDELGVKTNTLVALERRGLVTLEHEPATVNLQLARVDVPEQALALRGGDRQAAVLRMLAASDELQQSIRKVYAQSGAKLDDLRALAEEGLVILGEQEVWRDSLAGKAFVPAEPPILTPDQAQAWAVIEGELRREEPRKPILLHGVTGSGKTELYLRAVAETLAQGRAAIVLVPEIALTPQTLHRFAARFGGYGRMAVLHSRLSPGERFDAWRRARAGLVDIVVGPRSALFAPLPDVGLVVLDEAHDDSYKQSPPTPRPYYDTRRAVLALAEAHGALVLTGTATPDLMTYSQVERGRFRLLELPSRIMGHRRRVEEQASLHRVEQTRYQPIGNGAADALTIDLPPVRVVDMRQELRAGNRSIFSRALADALNETLVGGEQAILFLNRRGEATHVVCRDCGHVLHCPNCEVPLTQHGTHEARLTCHHCGYHTTPPSTCPECGSTRIRYFGAGTERVEALVRERWPEAVSLRWDRDTTGGRDAHEALLARFASGEANVLIGTQMVAKGLDLPLVTLVGVVSADVGLYLPDYRAGERVFQVLTQVAGRAGRGLLGGRVVLQTYAPEHYAVQAAAAHDFHAFYQREMAYRRQFGYPPVTSMARVVFRYPDAEQAQSAAETFAHHAQAVIDSEGLEATALIGPAPCFYQRLDGRYRWHVILRGPDPAAVLRAIDLAPEWQVDIDPVSTL
jgi:primosomal protein N' (replication factor Y)